MSMISTDTDASYDLDRPKFYLAMHNLVGSGPECKAYAQGLSRANIQSIAEFEPETTIYLVGSSTGNIGTCRQA